MLIGHKLARQHGGLKFPFNCSASEIHRPVVYHRVRKNDPEDPGVFVSTYAVLLFPAVDRSPTWRTRSWMLLLAPTSDWIKWHSVTCHKLFR